MACDMMVQTTGVMYGPVRTHSPLPSSSYQITAPTSNSSEEADQAEDVSTLLLASTGQCCAYCAPQQPFLFFILGSLHA